MDILFYSSTIILSLVLEPISKLIILKKMAMKGYKVNNFKLLSFKQSLYFIPFVNLIVVIKQIFSYYNLNKNNLIMLTKEEKDLLNNNFNIFDVLNINLKNKISSSMVLVYMKDGNENIIYFTKNNNKYVITSTVGPISNFPKTIQHEQLNKELDDILITDNNSTYDKLNPKENIHDMIDKLKNFKISLIGKQDAEFEKSKVYTKKIF